MFWTYSFFPFLHVLGIVFCIWIIVNLLRGSGWSGAERRGSDAALDLLKERYVKGEIDRDEYHAKKADLLD